MKQCLNCQTDFTPARCTGLYCGPNCRVKHHLLLKRQDISLKSMRYFVTEEGVRVKITKELLTDLLGEFNVKSNVSVNPNQPDIQPKKEVTVKVSVNYETQFSDCEFEEDYKSLLEKIQSDSSLNDAQKLLWRKRITGK